jgi:curved DNA-binding protein CbpA
MFVDYYEVLQVSPNADSETIRRIYHIQSQRFHPDNLETGNPETFRKLAEAYEVLSDPEQREFYDRNHRVERHVGNGSRGSAPPVMDEKRRREEILQLLYRRRFAHPEQPTLGLRDFETLLNTRKDELEFSLWYLKECGFLVRTDSARHTITIKGVQFAEAIQAGTAKWIEG